MLRDGLWDNREIELYKKNLLRGEDEDESSYHDRDFDLAEGSHQMALTWNYN